MRLQTSVHRVRDFVVHNLLHLDDTPERIALGVALGFFVAWTPTLGLQMIIYVLLATALRANKISGLGPVWITNPLTAIPIYYSNWWVGQLLARNGTKGRSAKEVEAALRAVEQAGSDLSKLDDPEFWAGMARALGSLGYELWLGSMVVGAVLAVAFYFVTLRGVRLYRLRKAEKEEALRAMGLED